jgi:hypothetical protein
MKNWQDLSHNTTSTVRTHLRDGRTVPRARGGNEHVERAQQNHNRHRVPRSSVIFPHLKSDNSNLPVFSIREEIYCTCITGFYTRYRYPRSDIWIPHALPDSTVGHLGEFGNGRNCHINAKEPVKLFLRSLSIVLLK